jgi:STE24 endopeptidase
MQSLSHPLTVAFLVALLLSTALRLWLSLRHLRHIAAHRAQVPESFAGRITPEAHQKAADYTTARGRLGMIETVLGAVVLLAFTLGGGLETLASAWQGVFGPTEGDAGLSPIAQGITLILSVAFISGVIDLPFGLYRTFVIEARFGFNRMTPALYFADMAKQTAIGLALGVPLLFCVLWLMERMGEHWWLWVWATWVGFNLLVLLLYPTLIAPLFNKFSPLEDASLKSRIEGLLAKCGFRAKGLYVMDGSKRSSHGNAYFTGFGSSRRIVFFDTLLSRLAPAEIEAVLAHELGHFSHRHVWKRIAVLFGASFLFLALLGWLIGQPWFYAALGVSTPSTAMALLLFFMVAPAFSFFLQPLSSLYSRRHEYEADAYAAEHAGAQDLVQALVKLYQDNAATLTPDPLHSAFYDSHPPAALRIARLLSLPARAATTLAPHGTPSSTGAQPSP